jgi:hypothetical protein
MKNLTKHAALSTNKQTVTASYPHACKQLHNNLNYTMNAARSQHKDRCRLALIQHDMYRTFTVAPQTGRSAALGLYKITSLVTVSYCSARRRVSTPAFRLSIFHVYLRSCSSGYYHLSPATVHEATADNQISQGITLFLFLSSVFMPPHILF